MGDDGKGGPVIVMGRRGGWVFLGFWKVWSMVGGVLVF